MHTFKTLHHSKYPTRTIWFGFKINTPKLKLGNPYIDPCTKLYILPSIPPLWNQEATGRGLDGKLDCSLVTFRWIFTRVFPFEPSSAGWWITKVSWQRLLNQLYHLESRWRNSHVLVDHSPLLRGIFWGLRHLLSRWYNWHFDFGRGRSGGRKFPFLGWGRFNFGGARFLF